MEHVVYHDFLIVLPLGLFVAPITTTDSDDVSNPSHICINCAFIMAVASWSWVSRDRNSESISSTKIIQGAIFRANVKTAEASFCDSPYLFKKWQVHTVTIFIVRFFGIN